MSRGHARSVGVALLFTVATLPSTAAAQAESEDVLVQTMQAVQVVDAQFDCSLELIGGLQTDALLGRHFVAYSAEGGDCDEAAEALGGRTADIDVQFMRRPNLGQLRKIVSDMIRSVEITTGCRIMLRGRPSLNEETSRWFVTYVASGTNCVGVQSSLRDLGDDLDISFIGGPARGRPDGIPGP